MLGKTHLLAGLATGLFLERSLALLNLLTTPTLPVEGPVSLPYPPGGLSPIPLPLPEIPTLVLIYGTVGLGSLLPDLDEPRSLMANLPRFAGQQLKGGLSRRGPEAVLRVGLMLVTGGLNGLTQWLAAGLRRLGVRHRGATHSLLAAVLVSLIATLAGWVGGYPALGLWLLLGYLSHLALDMLTPTGVTLLQPVSTRTYHLLPPKRRIRTGSARDRTLGLGLMLAAGLWAVLTTFLPLVLHRLAEGRWAVW